MDSYTASLMDQFVACAPPVELPEVKALPPLGPDELRAKLPIPDTDHQSEAI